MSRGRAPPLARRVADDSLTAQNQRRSSGLPCEPPLPLRVDASASMITPHTPARDEEEKSPRTLSSLSQSALSDSARTGPARYRSGRGGEVRTHAAATVACAGKGASRAATRSTRNAGAGVQRRPPREFGTEARLNGAPFRPRFRAALALRIGLKWGLAASRRRSATPRSGHGPGQRPRTRRPA